MWSHPTQALHAIPQSQLYPGQAANTGTGLAATFSTGAT
jgi:hypothetical protein